MSEFSQMLSKFIKERDTNIYMLAKYCNYDRANMYKLTSGKRNAPDLPFVKKLAEYIHLSPDEEKQLIEKYKISVVGYETYYRRKNIEEFLSEFAFAETALSMAQIDFRIDMESGKNIILKNSHDIESILIHMFTAEMKCEHGKIQMLVQPEIDGLSNVLNLCGHGEGNLRIDHIVRLSNKPDYMEGEKLYNLECLKKILPYYNYNYDYNTWYYYGDISANSYEFTMFPYMILTSEFGCLLTADMKNGYLISEPEMLEQMRNNFCRQQKQSRKLINCVENIAEQFETVGNMVATRYSGYGLQDDPCVMAFLEDELIQKYVAPQMEHREILVQMTTEYCRCLANQDVTYIFSMEGILNFLKTGIITELDPALYIPPTLEERVRIVEKILENGTRLLKSPMSDRKTNMNLYVTSEYGLLRIALPEKKVFLDIILEESELLHSFYDYCESMEEEMFYGRDEAEKIVRGEVEKLRTNQK